MTMEEWIKSTFSWIALGIDNGDGSKSDGFQFAYKNEDGRTIIVQSSIPRFIATFGSVPTPPTATALKAVDPEDKMGWHAHFDEWVRQGMIQP